MDIWYNTQFEEKIDYKTILSIACKLPGMDVYVYCLNLL